MNQFPLKACAVICLITFSAFGHAVAEPRNHPPTMEQVLQWWSENAEVSEIADVQHFHYIITPEHVHIDLLAQEVRIDVDTEGGQNIYPFEVFQLVSLKWRQSPNEPPSGRPRSASPSG